MSLKINKSQCAEFLANPTVNPLTGRRIQEGKGTHTKLMNQCKGRKEASPKLNTNFEAPPMGPMIHWRYNIKNSADEQNNLLAFCLYIEERIDKLKDLPAVSKMELEEFGSILKHAKQVFKDEDDVIEELEPLMKSVSKLIKTKTLIDDVPKAKIVALKEIKQSRVFIREQLLRCYQIWKDTLESIEESLHLKKVKIFVSRMEMRNTLETKQYLDYVIQHKIFSHDDIYKRMLPSERAYDDLKAKYELYRALYKKEKGQSL